MCTVLMTAMSSGVVQIVATPLLQKTRTFGFAFLLGTLVMNGKEPMDASTQRKSRALRSMTLAVSAGLLLLFSGCSVRGYHPRSTFGQATSADGWEQAFWAAVQKKDWAGVERHLATNFVLQTESGPVDKAAMVKRLQEMAVQDFQIQELRVVPEGADSVVTYTLVTHGAAGESRWRVLSVWQAQKKSEELVAQSMVRSAGQSNSQ
jgi:uncharacterized protein DUF4440